MSESTATAVYLAIAALLLMAGAWKAFVLQRHLAPEFAAQTVAHVLGGVVYVVASPWGYRRVGSALGQPWFPTLLVYLGILLCFGTWHMLTIAWTPLHPDQPEQTRRSIAAWSFAYALSIAVMIVTFLQADLTGPADPLKFNTDQVKGDPYVIVFLGVFLFMLACGTLTASRRSRRARPDDETLMHALRWYSASHLVVFGYVVCSAPAVAAAAMGHHQLDAVGVLGSAFGSVGTIMLCWGMSGAALSQWLAERRDLAALEPLWDLVVTGVDEKLSLELRLTEPEEGDLESADESGRSRPSRLIGVRWTLTRMLIEILDGIRLLERRGWIRDLPGQAVASLHKEALQTEALRSQLRLSRKGLSQLELEAAVTAAVLRDAVQRLQAAGPDGTAPIVAPGPQRFAPGKKTPAPLERRRQVLIARALYSPLVESSLQIVGTVRKEEGAPKTSPTAR
ncbi:DUF6545 domain-containing protein [Streptomyces sp. NPDC102476]|uniref:DUF6545 domain-containing protein n=1 Tax=Streptomyces sp. NPDC102476 TaxID=3366181 RepID=UPI00382C255D